ncbi:wings apart-like protein regulation of heterochromatin-domain-containing protein [Xylariaceae sp. FL0255]|nr:wings apart-like protein regulation of heterochromatin-domain-containing protein [Xylariaceae sp. FL0255]
MAKIKVDAAARPKKKMVNTYGKATRRRQPKAVFTPLTTSESMSDDDPIIASNAGPSPLQQPIVSSRTTSPASRLKGLGVSRDTQSKPALSQSIAGTSDRKRKISQVYPAKKDASQTAAARREVAGQGTRLSPERRRPRATISDDASTVKYIAKKGVHTASTPPDLMDIDQLGPSSPPPTPTPPKSSRVSSKVGADNNRISSRVDANNTKMKPASTMPSTSLKKVVPQQHQIPIHLAQKSVRIDIKPSTQPPATAEKSLQPSSLKSKAPISRPLAKPKKRLIDALKEQEPTDSIDPDEDRPTSPSRPSQLTLSQMNNSQISNSQTTNSSEYDLPSLPATPNQKARKAPTTATRTFTRSSSALKFTYGQGRKVMEEEDSLLDSLAFLDDSSFSQKGRRLELGVPKKSVPGGVYDDDDPAAHDSPSSKLRDIHELRQAGANSRVADAMQDLIDQMGKPATNSLSSRRAALVQVAEKVQDKTFIRQCRDHGLESYMLKDIGKETDLISGFLILCSLITIMAKSSSSHIARVVQDEEAGPLFTLLLDNGDDVKKTAKDRKSNLSRRSQNLITSIEASLRELSIWDENRPSYLSPRNVAIKGLQLLITQDVLICKNTTVFTEAVTNHLFEVLSDASANVEYWDHPATPQSTELCGALSVLDVHAVNLAASDSDDNMWTTRYLPIVADAFNTWIHAPKTDSKTLNDLMLKLTINATNNNLEAPEIFAAKGLLPAFTDSISTDFNQALASISQNSWTDGILDGVVLRLGILINFAEHSELVRQIVSDCHQNGREPLHELIQIYIEHHRRTGEADSMEKTHLNVALGYLSVLLGYMALHKPARLKVKSIHPAKSIQPLIDSIREFNAHYEQVENAIAEANPEGGNHGGYTEKLQDLVQRLCVKAVLD